MDATAIRELDPETVDKIAAGEVVERPASVVKELVENSLDADATRVAVAVERGGKDLVRVRDDGVGMTGDAVRKAVRQHTTSKIRDVDDLDGGIATLGFRGEALHTIGAVSKLAIRTKPRGGDRGTELRVEGGDVVAVEPTGCPEGTTVEVTDLFYNTPAREKYLRADRTEFARVNDVVTRYALANPSVAVSLEHDGREVFATTGRGDLRAAILAVYGREVAEAMVPVEVEAPADGPLAGLSGYVSHPETTRSSRDYVSTFVNGRWVKSAAAREAVVDAYGTQLAADRYPFAVLFLDVPADSVDVNVHPRKMEVRFADEAGLREQVETAVGETLLDHGLVRSSAPRGRSAPEETDVRPSSDGATAPGTAEDAAGGSTPGDGAGGPTAGDTAGDGSPGDAPADPTAGESTAGDPARNPSRADTADEVPPADAAGGSASGDGAGNPGSSGRGEPASSVGTSDRTTPGRKFVADEQRTLDDEPVSTEREYEQLPRLRVLGQYDDTYVIAAAPDGLVILDQHAADERVNYERLREQFAGEVTTQALAEPVELELTAGEAAAFEDSREALARLGFQASRTGERTVAVRTVPAVIADALDPELLRDVLSRATNGEAGDAPVEARADELLADLACYPSITGNTSLSAGSVLDLLAALDECENPYACPHGRPVLIQVDDGELDARFERDYPGHAGRRE